MAFHIYLNILVCFHFRKLSLRATAMKICFCWRRINQLMFDIQQKRALLNFSGSVGMKWLVLQILSALSGY